MTKEQPQRAIIYIVITVLVIIGISLLATVYNNGVFDEWLKKASKSTKQTEIPDFRSGAHKKCEASGGFYSDGTFGNQCIFK